MQKETINFLNEFMVVIGMVALKLIDVRCVSLQSL